MHKTFLVAVEQICALASYRLGYKEALTVFVVGKGCGVELHIAQMLNISAHIISKLYAVTGSDRRVCGIIVNSSYTACCKNGVLCGIIAVLSFVKHIKQEIVTALGKTEQV